MSEEHKLAAAGGMIAGKTYPFHLSFTNPLYDPIQVRLHVQRTAPQNTVPVPEGGKAPRAPFAVTLPSSAFPIAAYAEAWEYEDDEDMFGDEDDFEGARGMKDRDGRGKTRAVGVLERRANVTVVGGEIVLGKEAQGTIKVSFPISLCFNASLMKIVISHSLTCSSPILIGQTIRSLKARQKACRRQRLTGTQRRQR